MDQIREGCMEKPSFTHKKYNPTAPRTAPAQVVKPVLCLRQYSENRHQNDIKCRNKSSLAGIGRYKSHLLGIHRDKNNTATDQTASQQRFPFQKMFFLQSFLCSKIVRVCRLVKRCPAVGQKGKRSAEAPVSRSGNEARRNRTARYRPCRIAGRRMPTPR